MSDPSKDQPEGACPICAKPPKARFAPFCSGRCADLDLGRWLKGGYAIPGAPDEGTGEADGQSPATDPATGQTPEKEEE